jgi:hypothetical protein
LRFLAIDRTSLGVVGDAGSVMGRGDEMNWLSWSMWVASEEITLHLMNLQDS